MSSQASFEDRRADSKFTSVSFIVGGLLLGVFNALIPRPSDPADIEIVMKNMTDEFFMFQLGHLMLAVGMWCMLAGWAGLNASIESAGKPWVRAGFHGMVLATGLWIVTYGLTAVYAELATNWVGASGPERDRLFTMVTTLVKAGTAMYIVSGLFYWLAFAFIGFGMARSRLFPSWMSWSAVVLGVGMVGAVGVPQFMAGNVVTSAMLTFVGIAALTTVWLIATGVWMARRAWGSGHAEPAP